jgi:hypothetical protein
MFVFSWLMNSQLTNRRLDMARFLNPLVRDDAKQGAS